MKQAFNRLFYCLITLFLFICPLFANSQSITTFDIDVSSSNFQIIKTIPFPGNGLGVIVSDDSYSNIYLWVYNASGVQIANTNITARFNWPHTYHYNVDINAVSTGNGNIFITYAAISNSTGIQTYNSRYVLLNQNGEEQASGQLNNTDAGTSYIYQITLDRLSDGKILAVWRRSASGNIVFRLFNQTGIAFNTDISIAGPGTPDNYSSIYTFKAAAGKNGNFLVSLYYFNGNLRGYAYDNTGNNATGGAAPGFNLDPTVSNNYGNNDIVALANGNFVACWWLSGINYIKILAPDGSTAVNKQAISVSSFSSMLPLYTSGSEGFIITQKVMQNASDMTNPYSTLWQYKYDQSGVFQSSTAMPEGALIVPSYKFVSGSSGGFAYLYSYYKSFIVMGFPMNMYQVTGDMDTKAVTNGFSMTTLPVTLLSFEAKRLSNQQVLITWSTAGETNSSHFEIESSTDGNNFFIIGHIMANGITHAASNYSFTDTRVMTQNTFYKLKQFDIDGKWKDLGIRLVRNSNKSASPSVFPNPVKGNTITVLTADQALPAPYRITDTQGRILQQGILRQSQEEINVHDIPEGIFFLQAGNKIIMIKK